MSILQIMHYYKWVKETVQLQCNLYIYEKKLIYLFKISTNQISWSMRLSLEDWKGKIEFSPGNFPS